MSVAVGGCSGGDDVPRSTATGGESGLTTAMVTVAMSDSKPSLNSEKRRLELSARQSSSPKRSMDILHEEDEVQRIGGRWLDAGDEVEIEIPGVLALGVDEKTSTTDSGS
jgi:hypothetical protein